MSDNEYYGPFLKDNKYAAQWIKLFSKKEKDVELLLSIVDSDAENEEDTIICFSGLTASS